MAFYVNERLYFDFYLNNQQMPFKIDNINSLVINYNIHDILPTLRLDLLDNRNLISRGLLTDGAILSVAVGSDQDTALKNIVDFVLVGVPEEQRLTNANNYIVYGVMNFPKLMRSEQPFYAKGSSNQALEKIAKYCGLSYDGYVTVDDQAWFSGTRNLGQFSKYIADHGYSDDESFMQTTVNLEKTMIYRNVNQLPPAKYSISNMAINSTSIDSNFMFSDIKFVNKAGVYNYNYGYQTQLTEYGPSSDFDTVCDSLHFTKVDSAVLNINQEAMKNAGLVRNMFMPINVGNNHANFAKAFYQNIRNKALNSIKAEVYFDYRTPIEVLTKIKLALADPASKQINIEKAPAWTVEGKTMAISQQLYTEKLLISSTGIESDLFNSLV